MNSDFAASSVESDPAGSMRIHRFRNKRPRHDALAPVSIRNPSDPIPYSCFSPLLLVLCSENDSRAHLHVGVAPVYDRGLSSLLLLSDSLSLSLFTLFTRICIFIFIAKEHHGAFVLCLERHRRISSSLSFLSLQESLLMDFPPACSRLVDTRRAETTRKKIGECE